MKECSDLVFLALAGFAATAATAIQQQRAANTL
jgi:hypothetical protein